MTRRSVHIHIYRFQVKDPKHELDDEDSMHEYTQLQELTRALGVGLYTSKLIPGMYRDLRVPIFAAARTVPEYHVQL